MQNVYGYQTPHASALINVIDRRVEPAEVSMESQGHAVRARRLESMWMHDIRRTRNNQARHTQQQLQLNTHTIVSLKNILIVEMFLNLKVQQQSS